MLNPVLIRIPHTASTSICIALGKHFDHYPASKIKKDMGEEWDKAFKFTIVRNPYDRFISMFNDFIRDGTPFEDYVKSRQFISSILFKPQMYYLDEPIDYIGRFEELGQSWDSICSYLGLNVNLPHIRKNKPIKRELTNELKNIIHEYYLQDFQLLNYT